MAGTMTRGESEFDNADALFEQMRKDELEDASKLTPREYGKLRGISPQLVYYHLRKPKPPEGSTEKYLEFERCLCGKKVIDVKRADEYFKRGEFDPNFGKDNQD